MSFNYQDIEFHIALHDIIKRMTLNHEIKDMRKIIDRLKDSGQPELDKFGKMLDNEITDLNDQESMDRDRDRESKSNYQCDREMYRKYYQWINSLVRYPWIPHNYRDMFDDPRFYQTVNTLRERFDHVFEGYCHEKDKICNILIKWAHCNYNKQKVMWISGNELSRKRKMLLIDILFQSIGVHYSKICLSDPKTKEMIPSVHELTGYGFVYIGSESGKIINAMVKNKSPTSGIVFNCDGLNGSNNNIRKIWKEFEDVMIHLTDKNHKTMHSNFFGDIAFPYSRSIIILDCNGFPPTELDPILKNRFIDRDCII